MLHDGRGPDGLRCTGPHFKDGESKTKVPIRAHDAIRMMHQLPDMQSRVTWTGGRAEGKKWPIFDICT